MKYPLLLIAALLAVIGPLAALGSAQARVEVEAYRGEPFGVGRITLASGGDLRLNIPPLARPNAPGRRGARIADLARRLADKAGVQTDATTLEATDMSLVERAGRIFYPVFDKRERPILREFVDVPKQVTVFFLFQGDAPLELTLYGVQPQTGSVVPRRDPQGHARLLEAWWRDFSAAADARSTPRDFPPIVEEYLVDTLSRRLSLAIPERAPASSTSVLAAELNLLAGTESARQEAAREILLAGPAPPLASETLPEELPPPKPEVLNPAEAEVEPLAMHVPIECFYVRFGSFPNFLWLRQRMEQWGGELRDIISERGFDYGLNDRMERQLALRTSKTAELFGERVIGDVAMIGTDTFLREGAAIGVMFHAKNNLALTADFTQQRAAIVKETPGAKLELIKIDGRPVSFIGTPDNTLRSFYASDGDFHLITTSRTIVERFLATGAGKHESLGASEAFRLARTHMPLARNDTVFAYFSPAFFHNLLSGPYQIELARRMRSAVEIELVPIARLAARGEGRPAESIDQLVAAGFLPQGFGQRSDGSQLVVDGAAISDSVRGAAGTFLPVPDVPVSKVTPQELATYQQFAETFQSSWGAMDPIVAGVQRAPVGDGKLERVTVDLKAAPLSPQHTQMLSQWLGPPTDQRLAPIEGDVVSFEAVMRGGSFFAGQEHHLFGALRDADPAIALDPRSGLIAQLIKAQLQGLQGYLGAWPNPGFLQLFVGLLEGQPDANGFSRSLTGVWRRQFQNFTLLSFHPEILQMISPQLRFVKAERPAQVWIHAGDLANSRLAPFINAYGYRQSRQIALGNARFMNMLVEQLHVVPADAMTTAERLLGAKLLEPLGGKYELTDLSGGRRAWTSTSLVKNPDASQPPADYQFPALNWFRSVDLELMTEGDQLAIHGQMIMPAETKSEGMKLPGLPFTLPKLPVPKAPPSAKSGAKPAPAAVPVPSGKREF
ncbi:MAG: hypothetical protein AB7O59_03800 [Pirellulales bacterium]